MCSQNKRDADITSLVKMVVLMNTNFFVVRMHKFILARQSSRPYTRKRLGLGEFGDGLGALGHGVLGKLAREHKSHTRLHLAGGQSGFSVVAGQAAGLDAQTLEHVLDERVHDGHSALGDTSVGVHLLQHLVDVGRVALDSPLAAGGGRCLLVRFSFLGGSFNHFEM